MMVLWLVVIGIIYSCFEGYIDNYGEDSYNEVLLFKWVNSVVDVWVEGVYVLCSNLVICGFGKKYLIVSNDMVVGCVENCWVMVVISML